ncbi:MAG TPA: gephyrin-like molybdotransferase Glp [Burkholderiaceae bacterium]|nr:gephyrin-like molybdotransferase Glp [Burkholderiaceae bacterium]
MNEPELDPPAALEKLTARIEPLRELESVRLDAALGRVLGADVIATLDVPPFDNAAMDGYALRAADHAATLRVVGRALAGHPFDGLLGPGQAVRIMTGAALPSGADAVALQEDVRGDSERITVDSSVAPGLNVRPRGEQFDRGTAVLKRGRKLRSYDLGLAAAAGARALTVVRRVRVGVLSTGDELLDPPAPPASSEQYDGNRPMLCASLAHDGFEIVDLGIVGDRDEALNASLAAAGRHGLDAVLSTGGVAQGDADIVRRQGMLEFIPLALRPGRGIAFGRMELDGHAFWYVGMPGNAVAAYVVYHLVTAPLLAHLAGAREERPLFVEVPLSRATRTRAGRVDWRRGRFIVRDGRVAVELLAQQGSSMLRTLSEADALVGIGPEPTTAAGQPVPVIPLAALP